MRNIILFSLMLFAISAKAQEPTFDTTLCQMYTLNNPGPLERELNEEYVITDGDTLEGFWPTGNSVFIAPKTNSVFEFSSCGTIMQPLPVGFISKQWLYDRGYITQLLPDAPNYHYSQPMQMMGLGSYMAGRYLLGYSEGLSTTEAAERTAKGLHYKSKEAHSTELAGEIFAYAGLSTFVTGSVLWEIKLRKCAPRKGFWYSTGFWPTVARNGIGLAATLLSGYVSAQYGYNNVVNNP